jgi:hypothetical protein
MPMQINGPIERVPLPSGGQRGPAPVYQIEDLEVGDSRLFMAEPRLVRAAVWKRARKLGLRFISKAEGKGVRVWRVA